MYYCDLHCDALTTESALQVTAERLSKGNCLLQCFAAFISARENRFERALALCEKFQTLKGVHPVTSCSELKEGEVNALLTVEEGGAIEGDLQKLEALYSRGVRMMTLTWNYPNEIGYPAFPDYEGLLAGRSTLKERECSRGLTPFGFQAVERMFALGMITDVSHGSDKLVLDVATFQKPFVASHSGAREVYDCARNLTREGIRAIADCGGVVGLDFCADFLSDNQTAEGQKEALLRHARAILNAGGEDLLALGSDFDGIPPNPYLPDASCVPKLLGEFERAFGSRITEKIASKNFLRVFKQICN